MKVNNVKILVLALLNVVLAFLLSSCVNPFAPAEAESRFLAPIADQSDTSDATAAGNVLANFKYAYENNDIDVYENCLDDEFVFIYTDQDRYGEIEIVEVLRDGVSGDIYRTRRLFEIFDEIRLDTWLPLRSERELENHPDHPDEIWEVRNVNFHLVLRDITGYDCYAQFEASGLAEFKMRRSSNGVMRIRIWEDKSIGE